MKAFRDSKYMRLMEHGIELFNKATKTPDLKIDSVTVNAAVWLCADVVQRKKRKMKIAKITEETHDELFTDSIKSVLEIAQRSATQVSTCGALMRLHAKIGNYDEVKNLYLSLENDRQQSSVKQPIPLYIENMLMTAAYETGLYEEGLKIIDRLQNKKINADSVSVMLKICEAAGKWQKGVAIVNRWDIDSGGGATWRNCELMLKLTKNIEQYLSGDNKNDYTKVLAQKVNLENKIASRVLTHFKKFKILYSHIDYRGVYDNVIPDTLLIAVSTHIAHAGCLDNLFHYALHQRIGKDNSVMIKIIKKLFKHYNDKNRWREVCSLLQRLR